MQKGPSNNQLENARVCRRAVHDTQQTVMSQLLVYMPKPISTGTGNPEGPSCLSKGDKILVTRLD